VKTELQRKRKRIEEEYLKTDDVFIEKENKD